MNNRQDALLAAAKFIEAVNRIVTSIPGRQVGTVGRIQALPGAPNVIPGKVVFSLELRDLDAAKIQMLYQKIRTEADQIAKASKTTFDFKEINVNIPAPTDPRIRSLIGESAKELGLSTKQMPSGAGHDAQDMARLAPVGMIFIPSVGGISHSPKEFSRPQDITNGANVLLGAVLKVDRANLFHAESVKYDSPGRPGRPGNLISRRVAPMAEAGTIRSRTTFGTLISLCRPFRAWIFSYS